MSNPPFDTVVRDHGDAVLRVCRAVLGPGADAEDAWSETFLAALAAYPTLDPQANVRGWLVTIAHRKAIDVHRGHARRAHPLAELPERPSTTALPGSTDDAAEVRAALAALPEKQRMVLAYRHFADLPYADIAAILGGTVPAARRAAADGLATLRRRLHNPHHGGTE